MSAAAMTGIAGLKIGQRVRFEERTSKHSGKPERSLSRFCDVLSSGGGASSGPAVFLTSDLSLQRARLRPWVHQDFPPIAGDKQYVAAYEMDDNLVLVGWVRSHVSDHVQIHVGYLATDCGNSDKLCHEFRLQAPGNGLLFKPGESQRFPILPSTFAEWTTMMVAVWRSIVVHLPRLIVIRLSGSQRMCWRQVHSGLGGRRCSDAGGE
jgi:hypothetical protein